MSVNFRLPLSLTKKILTIGLCGFNFLEQTLEPTERGGITTDPEELDTPEGTKVALPLAVPNVLENGGEWRYTYLKRRD